MARGWKDDKPISATHDGHCRNEEWPEPLQDSFWKNGWGRRHPSSVIHAPNGLWASREYRSTPSPRYPNTRISVPPPPPPSTRPLGYGVGVAVPGQRAGPKLRTLSPLCDIPSGCCSFTGPWTVTRSSLRMLRRVAAFCRPLRPVLPLVSFPRSRSPVVGVPGLC